VDSILNFLAHSDFGLEHLIGEAQVGGSPLNLLFQISMASKHESLLLQELFLESLVLERES
jgi:hypothetical protein